MEITEVNKVGVKEKCLKKSLETQDMEARDARSTGLHTDKNLTNKKWRDASVAQRVTK